MPFRIIRNNIAAVEADAIVNSADPQPIAGGGADGAIYRAAGKEELLLARKAIGYIEPGQAFETPAFNLKARYIIHTVGPVWRGGSHSELVTLRQCYENCLKLAEKLGCTSIAFPLISSGSFGFPKEEALQTAMSSIGKYLLNHDMEIILVVYDLESFMLSRHEYDNVRSYIDEHLDYAFNRSRRAREEVFHQQKLPEGDTFQERLFRLIDQRGLTDPEVYKKANLDKKLFSKIRSDKNYHPKKDTVISLGVALKLNLAQMRDLLARAGYAFSPGDRRDLIIESFFVRGNPDIYEIESMLFSLGEKTLYRY